MACLIDNFEVDTYDLQQDLRLETREMSQYFHEIGARVRAFSAAEGKKMGLDKVAIAQRRTAKLKLPLDFPRASSGRKR
jgi:DNA-directed RNA polymerase I subunit RPA49